ncbi:Signal transduction histidine kinase [Pseudooceanicola antarcticus]|uniref:histidine kinase n=1 Tax=Pseudooceanicola antarcticus TaxID=1247613 RepID=A0A285J3A6_9RHOB|nr:HAMP domain-containing sensor histidine kinase [Pseudooceanicola antarcticus]PJE29694.1 sensor histidine kinase [Pseudooceanicola antarcticus]SNY54805.1 Signal transduction histidine kinase [Pseudooceanicola antarcticus]
MRHRRGTASLRVTLGIAAGIIVISLSAMGLQYQLTARALAARQAELLETDLEAFAANYQQRRIPALRQAIDFRSETMVPDEAIYLLQDREGVKLAGNIDGWPLGIAPEGARFAPDPVLVYHLPLGPGGTEIAYRGIARELPGGFRFLTARAETPREATLARLRAVILPVAAGLVALALLAGWLTSRWVLARIERINRLADRVAAGDLSARLPGQRPDDEFGLLETHVHAMLDRIEALNRATQSLSDLIAHELRTPLNRILQKIRALDAPGERKAELEAEIHATTRTFNALLDISSAEASSGTRPGFSPVDLSELAAELVELYQPLAEDKGLSLGADLSAGCIVLAERNLIAQVLTNLLDNAIKFCAPGDTIALSLHPSEARHLMVVEDSGPGLPAEIRSEVTRRFVRAERDRAVPGHGLGLALVQAVATHHGARLALPDTAKGFRIEISWPRLAD